MTTIKDESFESFYKKVIIKQLENYEKLYKKHQRFI